MLFLSLLDQIHHILFWKNGAKKEEEESHPIPELLISKASVRWF